MTKKAKNTSKRSVVGYFVTAKDESVAFELTREYARIVAKALGGRKAGVAIQQVVELVREVR